MLLNARRYLDAGLIRNLTIGCGDWTDQQEHDIELKNWLNLIRMILLDIMLIQELGV